jgi:hypothetical protein
LRFSTTRFFTDQFLRSYRMSRLKELLLLALRMALCALFAAALARPLFRPPGQAVRLGTSRAVVLVLDDSASMGYLDDGRSLLARAQDAALAVLGELREGTDTASVVLASRRAAGPDVLFPEATLALGDVRQAVRDAAPQTLGTDLAGAVARAEEILEKSAAESREVYVLSDLQDAGWELDVLPEASSQAARNLYFFVAVRPREAENLAVTAVQYGASRPIAGVPFAVRPHVRNDSAAVRACEVNLFVDRQRVAQRTLDAVQPGRWAVPRFHYAFDRPGWHHGYVEIADGGTGLEADDRRYFAFEVLGEVRVLAVNGAPSAVARLDELFYLRTALGASAGQASSVRLDAIGPSALAQQDLAGVPLVVLANVESLAAPAVEKLESYVDAGGSLLVFLGDKVQAADYNQLFTGTARLHGGLLPGRLAAVEGDPAGETTVASIAAADDDESGLGLADDAELGSLAGVTFTALWRVEPGDESSVLLRTDAGLPLLVEKPFGKGRVALFASTVDRDWTNFPVRPAFLPWTYRLLGHLAQGPLDRDGFYHTGQRVDVPVSAAEGLPQVLVRKPDGGLVPAVATGDPAAPLAFDDTAAAGVYELRVPPTPGTEGRVANPSLEGADSQSSLFVANLENDESDLLYLDDVLVEGTDGDRDAAISTAIAEHLLPGRQQVAFVSSPDGLSEASLALRQGWPLWNVVLVVALAIALFEPWLANRVSQRHYARPQEVKLPQPVATTRPLVPERNGQRAAERPEAEVSR